MKYLPGSSDPSARAGNRRIRTGATIMAGALALASCTSSGNSSAPTPAITTTRPAPEITPTTTSPEQMQEVVKGRVQSIAELFAGQIINEFQKGRSRDSYIYNPKDGSNAAVNVFYRTGTAVPGAYGEYALMASVHRDNQGNFDPTSVDTISVSESVNVAGNKIARKPGDRINLYGFMLSKDKTTGHWSILVNEEAGGGAAQTMHFDTSTTANMDSNVYSVLSEGMLDSLTAQAATVFGWAVDRLPVNYPPQTMK